MSTKAQRVRDDIADDLLKLAQVLEENIAGFSADDLRRASSDCRSATRYGRSSWGYRVSSLSFPDYDPSDNLRPEVAQESEVYLEIELRIAGRCEEIEEGQDPLHELKFDLLVWGRDAERSLLCAWHLDRHIFEEGDPMYSDHPVYHFQFGGKRMWEEIDDYGCVLIPEPPRVAHPPLDAILGVNFVLANYFGNDWRNLADESEYEKLLIRAQQRLWRPYAQALASAWKPGPYENQPWTPNLIWPQLVDNYQSI